ncbi:MAG: DUF4290 domain-containing protein [Bacteroidales bacterium]|nr:DUF4290 domain-containing protein [Bacteroidales bacterium]HPD96545.1 DUF4290 domain-containing protein [Tenuifilaceae bacterium]HRX32515.1 DUF4290 domain-containing protein [Tenuifilaceae bacterium]
MDYNTKRKKLVLPEYGRHIHQMVDYVTNVQDRDERNRLARSLVVIMGNLNPHLRNVEDFKHKLWDHIFIMSDFKLDIDSPYPRPNLEQYEEKPRKVPYPHNPVKFKHYGRLIEQMIEKAVDYEEGSEKDALKQLIANQMKKANMTWNKESVSDEDIFRDMNVLSEGRLVMAPGSKLVENRDFRQRNRNKHHRKR